MALTKDTPRKPLGGHWVDYPMLASATIYEGSLVGSSGGYARALVAGDTFLGIAQKGHVETTAADGGETCRTRVGVWREEFTLSGVAVTDIGAAVYASDDATLTLTAGTNSPVGKVARYVSANLAEVEFKSNDANAITLSSSYDVSVKSNDDLTLIPGKAAADKVVIQAYDIDATAYVDVLTASSHATDPTLALAAPGAITVDGSTGTADMTLTAGNDLVLKAGDAAADLVTINVYDVDATAYVAVLSAAGHASAPTLALAAPGAITINGSTGTADMTLTSGNDLILRGGDAAADLVTIAVYDVDATAYQTVFSAAGHASDPTLTLAASGGITANGALTLSNYAGTGAGSIAAVAGQNITVTAGNDLALKAGPLAADLVTLQAYDVDATAYVTLVSAGGHATVPQLILGNTAAGCSIGFFGSTGATQQANIAAISTNETSASNLTPTINSILTALNNYFLLATA